MKQLREAAAEKLGSPPDLGDDYDIKLEAWQARFLLNLDYDGYNCADFLEELNGFLELRGLEIVNVNPDCDYSLAIVKLGKNKPLQLSQGKMR
jgi:hypothetical protein